MLAPLSCFISRGYVFAKNCCYRSGLLNNFSITRHPHRTGVIQSFKALTKRRIPGVRPCFRFLRLYRRSLPAGFGLGETAPNASRRDGSGCSRCLDGLSQTEPPGRGAWQSCDDEPGTASAEDQRWWSKWPLPQPRAWTDLVNQPETEGELAAIRRSVTRSQPYP